ncbi:MAG TPA: hypothetical protein VLW85_23520 [Myxococcales bacterium]|nr:hypothetical protein [Myxococcales bacterium]
MIALVAVALFTNTTQVESIAVAGAFLWAATGGGVEEYALPGGDRRRLYTTLDGLPSNLVLRVWHDGSLHVRTAGAACVLGRDRFDCAPAPPLARELPAPGQRYRGARETGRIAWGRHLIVATSEGVFLDGRRLTPEGQVCGNQISALAAYDGRVWAGSFDQGLCVLEGGAWRTPRTPFGMVNDLCPTPRGLYVAAAEGLFLTRDGRTFRREWRVRQRGANRLAASHRWLLVTTPASLYAVRLEGRDIVKRFRRPGGSTALQAVALNGAEIWLASEDRGIIRMRGQKFEIFDKAAGLPSSWMVDVAPSRDGGIWAATLRDGAVELGRDGQLRAALRPDAWGLRLYRDGERVLFGTQQGLEGAGPTALPNPHVHALLRTGDVLWIGTEGGLVQQLSR